MLKEEKKNQKSKGRVPRIILKDQSWYDPEADLVTRGTKGIYAPWGEYIKNPWPEGGIKPKACLACNSRSHWQSLQGAVRCWICHPPAAPSTVEYLLP